MNGQLAPLLLAVRKQCIEVRGAQLQQSKTRERTQLRAPYHLPGQPSAPHGPTVSYLLTVKKNHYPLDTASSAFHLQHPGHTVQGVCKQAYVVQGGFRHLADLSLSFFFWVCVICVCMCLHALMYVPQWAFGQPRVLVLTFYLLWDSFILFYLGMCVLGTWTQVLNLHASILPTELTPKMPFNVSYKDPSH